MPARKRRPGNKAGKRRTLRVAVPRVGDLVAIRWVDSGLFVYREGNPHRDLDLKKIVTYGLVVYRDKYKTILASEHADNMDDIEGQQRNVIWTKSIIDVNVLRRAAK